MSHKKTIRGLFPVIDINLCKLFTSHEQRICLRTDKPLHPARTDHDLGRREPSGADGRPHQRLHHRRRNRRRILRTAQSTRVPDQKGLDVHIQSELHSASRVDRLRKGTRGRHLAGFPQTHQPRHQTHAAAVPAIYRLSVSGNPAQGVSGPAELHRPDRTGAQRPRVRILDRDHRRSDFQHALQGRGDPDTTSTNEASDSTPGSCASPRNTSRHSSNASAGNPRRNGSTASSFSKPRRCSNTPT